MTLFFPQNYILPECKAEWNREVITVFYRLPSLRRLQATPLLQPSLMTGPRKPITFTSLPPKVSLMGHIDALSLSLRHEDKPPKITKVTQEALR